MPRAESAIRAARLAWRGARTSPVLGSLLAVVDRAWWLRVVLRSRLVDGEYYAAQRRWRRGGDLRASIDYVARGFQAGVSPNPLFDEEFAGRELPDLGRVPALYAYLVSDRTSVQVHPWWPAAEYAERNGVTTGALEHAWMNRTSATVTAQVAGRRRALAVHEWRRIVIDAAQRERLGSTRSMPVTVVRILQGGDRHHDAKVGPAIEMSPGADVELACIDVGPSAWSSVAIAASACEVDAPIAATRSARGTRFADVLTRCAEASGDGVVVMLDPRITPSASDIERLAKLGARALAAPAVVASDGTIAAVGAAIVATDAGPRRTRVLEGHPSEDLDPLGSGEFEVPLLTGRTFACPSAVLRQIAQPPPAEGWELEVLSARIRSLDQHVPLIVDAGVVARCFAPEAAFSHAATSLPATLAHAVSASDDLDEIHRRAGFEVVAWRAGSTSEATPRLRRLGARQRWAIKTAAPAGPPGEAWGDVHFARGLASALRRLGHEVVTDSRAAANRPTTYLDDVHLVVRGPAQILPPPNGVRIEWIISHPDEITREESSAFDLVFAVSARWAKRTAAEWGRDVGHLLEATDADIFHPHSAPRNRDLVFVGTARGIPRPSVVAPLAAGIDVKVYGPDWRGFIEPRAIVAPGIANSELPELYGAASAVLNDQWPAMRREGFIAMRPFDVVAAGGRVISESVEGLGEIFGESLVEYETPEHLVELLSGDIDLLFPPESRLAQIAARIRADHSFDARAAALDAAVRKFAGSVPVH